MRKKYWFYIDSYVHISIKKNTVLFYNPYTGKILEYNNEPGILGLVKKLRLPANLRVVPLWETELNNPVIREFVSNIKENFMGDLLETGASHSKPVQLPPFPKVNKDVKYLKMDKNRSVGEDIMDYLTDLRIYVNDRCRHHCNICAGAYRQFPCCTSGRRGQRELVIDYLKTLTEETRSAPYLDYHILGGSIFEYSMMEQAIEIIKGLSNRKIFYIHYLNVKPGKERLKMLKEAGGELMMLINWPLDEVKLKLALDTVFTSGIESNITFIIRDEQDFAQADRIIDGYSLRTFEVKALYTGSNRAFFEENIYIGNDEIEEARPSLKDIYSRSFVNAFHFGKLTVLPNRAVYADVNAPYLGILGKDSIYEIMMKELSQGKSWRNIRRNVSPCKSCTYECLCPPISNYSTAIGRYDMCRIRKEKTWGKDRKMETQRTEP